MTYLLLRWTQKMMSHPPMPHPHCLVGLFILSTTTKKMAEQTAMCVLAFQSGDKETSLRLLAKLHQPQTIRDYWDENKTLVHYAAKNGWDDICKLLIEKYHCDPLATDRNGHMPLHLACLNGSVPTVKYLLSLPNGIRSINHKNVNGHTPLHFACGSAHLPVIDILLSTPSISITEKDSDGRTPIECHPKRNKYAALSLFASRIDWNTEIFIKPYFNVFLTGNSAAGKTTLATLMVELTKYEQRPRHDKVSAVKELTAGVIPTHCTGNFYFLETFYSSLHFDTSIVIYDLAGQSEYYGSHAAMLESLCLESPAVFVIMVDLTHSEDQLAKEIYNWSNFLEIESSSISSHVIVVGSRKDKFSSEPQLLTSKCKYVEDTAKEALRKQYFAGFVAIDSRELSRENAHPFLIILTESIKELIVSRVHNKMSFTCHLLYAFIQETVKVKAISFVSLQKQVSRVDTLSRLSNPTTLTSSLEILADKGLILFLRNRNCLSSSCIIIDKTSLLQEINGTLFAPTFLREHRPIASNTGIVAVSLLHQIFPHYHPDILVAMLTSLQFCRPVDPAVLTNVTTNLSLESATSDQLLYFPSLVSAERPGDLFISEGFGWCVYCTNPRKCLTRRCHDALLLDLAYKFCLSSPTPPKLMHPNEVVVRKLNRECIVWNNGIYWCTNDDIEVMVQVTEENRCVSLSLSLDRKRPVRWLQLRSSVIGRIRSKQKELCSSVEVSEYLISSSQLPQISHSNLLQLTVFEMKDVARSMLLEDSFVLGVDKERISPESLLFSDPYQVLPPTVVQQLFASDKSSEPVPASLLKKIKHRISGISISNQSTHKSVQEQLNMLSVFAGRNPLELAGLTADDLPLPSPDTDDASPTNATPTLPGGSIHIEHHYEGPVQIGVLSTGSGPVDASHMTLQQSRPS